MSLQTHSILAGKASVAAGDGETKTVAKWSNVRKDRALNVRFRIKAASVTLGGGTLTATIYHAPSQSDTLVSTGKTVSITGNGDFYAVINESDTTLVPLMPYIEIKVVSGTPAVGTITAVDVIG